MKRFFQKKRRWVLGLIWVLTIGLNVTAWLCAPFCDWYTAHVFPVWLNTYGRLSGLFSVSIGEWMLYLAAVLVLLSLVLWIVWLPVYVVRRCGTGGHGLSRSGFDRFVLRFYQAGAWIVTVVCLIMTLNCLIFYHCTPIQESGEPYDLEELIALRERIVTNCNRLSEQMQRDERGEIVYDGDMKERAIQAMHALAEREGISRLRGYYSEPKPLYASWFFCQQYMCGYYFPFSLEANYNDMMYIMNFPYTMCHELSHLKGYIYENEANYLAYLACVESGDKVFEYSGYLNVMYYVERDLIDALEQRGEMARYERLTPVKEQVHLDNVYVTSEQWEKVNEQSPLDTKLVSDVTDTFLEANLTVNGVSDGVVSYSRVVGLLLSYYHENGDEGNTD
ncbi:MAG: DUF3810 domain-containing protein [Lachnospiraceae bacterium]|nr:DUF3810 domain-containing protein [Lachnospiraceae bacterium]